MARRFWGGTHDDAGGAGLGTLFQITPSGTLTTLYNFCSLAKCTDGGFPGALVMGSDGNLYGTTQEGGTGTRSNGNCGIQLTNGVTDGCGTFFQSTLSGVPNTLYSFCSQKSCVDGRQPETVVQASSGTFYGTTFYGGGCSISIEGCGTIFSWSPNVALAPTFSPSSTSFGNEAINTTSSPKTISIKNPNRGTATLVLSNFSTAPPFAISSTTCGTTLKAGGTCSVKLTFAPTALGAANGSLSVADNAPGSPQLEPLSGTGVAQTTLTPASLTFANQKVGTTSAAKKVTLKNNLPTTLTGISYSTAAPFAVSASTCGTTLASKQTCTISVTFSPTTVGPASGTFSVTDSANDSPQTVNLSGTGD